MRQNFDQTFCCHGDCANTDCDRRMNDETSAALPLNRYISQADFKTDTCGYRVGKDCEI